MPLMGKTEKTSETANKISLASLFLAAIIALAINVPFAIWNFQQNNRAIDIANENLTITNMMENFNPNITAEQSFGIFNTSSSNTFPNGTIESFDGIAQLNISLKVVTPHYSHIIIQVGNFTNLDQQYWINREMENYTTVSYFFEEPFEDIVGSGLTQVNATLQLSTTVYPDPQQLPIGSGNWTRFYLGPLDFEVHLYDIQTQKNSTEEFTEPMAFNITMP
jgi:hypothetical protein